MAKAKKLPSGKYRCLAFSHTEKVLDPKTGQMKDKRVYVSFTREKRKEAELAAAQFQAERTPATLKKRQEYGGMTPTEAIDLYIGSREMLGRSPTTIQDYRCIQRNGFQDLMQTKIKDMDEVILQEAIRVEAGRPANRRSKHPRPISAKRLRNEWGLISSVLHKYTNRLNFDAIELPRPANRSVELPPARDVLRIVRGTDIELPVLLAMWLSFSMSEIRGLTKSKSISGDYLTIREVVVDVGGEPYRKDMAKNPTRNRRHRIPPYIMSLIEKVEGDALVSMSGKTLYHKWIHLQDEHGMDHITFHDLRHLNASVMALLRVPDKYAQERGGWKTDKVMKEIYMQTFSEERERVDDLIDGYFEDIMQHEMQHETKKVQ